MSKKKVTGQVNGNIAKYNWKWRDRQDFLYHGSSTPSGLSEYLFSHGKITPLSTDSTEVSLDPETAHPKLVISLHGDSVTYTDTWQELPELPGRFDTTLNVISLQGFSSGRHYWEIDVAGKTYWELGLTYPTISRKGRAEDCWLGRGSDSWAMEFFDGEYTAWHGGVPHQLPVTKHLSRIGVLCSFPAGLVSFLGADSMTPLFSFCILVPIWDSTLPRSDGTVAHGTQKYS
uniref:B30.2/SPRY domain-containing protein n=1 Tax=Oncorhynchus mykiss TaxID=8022 RepID=A0A8C7QI66_ONCMY